MERKILPTIIILLTLFCAIILAKQTVKNNTTSSHQHYEDEHNECGNHSGIRLADWNFCGVGRYVIIITTLIACGLAKVAFHKAHWLSSRFPESCILIILGILVGLGLKIWGHDNHIFEWLEFSPSLFFNLLLPPIILESAYSLYDPVFFYNLPTILVMAIIGTLANFILVGGLLFIVTEIGALGSILKTNNISDLDNVVPQSHNLELLEILLFASLITAVDPVAVLAIFQEVGVNPDLYFLVFGESLFNDGVAVVLYKTMATFTSMETKNIQIDEKQYILAILSFFTIAFGGLIIGILIGFATALLTKMTKDVSIMEPLIVFGMAYFAYMGAELFHWSGIISLIGCGLIQSHYAFKNITKNSQTTIEYFVKMTASLSETTIFLFLGIALTQEKFVIGWNVGFVFWSLIFCLLSRFVVVYGFIGIINKYRVRKINYQEQFIMAYGGLRGAVGFSLVELIDENVKIKNIFVTATLVITMFTIFIQGGTIKWYVNLLKIDKKKDGQKYITHEVNDTVIEHIMEGIDFISGKYGNHYLYVRITLMAQFDQNYLKKFFCVKKKENEMTVLYEKLALSDHLVNLYGPTLVHERGKGGDLLKQIQTPDTGIELVDLLDKRKQEEDKISNSENTFVRKLTSSFRKRSQRKINPKLEEGSGEAASKEELEHVRSVLKKNKWNSQSLKLYNRTKVEDPIRMKMWENLRNRHSKANRISQIMMMQNDLHHQEAIHDPTRVEIRPKLSAANFRRYNSVIEESSSSEALEDYNNINKLISTTSILHKIPQSVRPGVQAVLQNQVERIQRIHSISSDGATEAEPSAAYFDVNEVIVDSEETNRKTL